MAELDPDDTRTRPGRPTSASATISAPEEGLIAGELVGRYRVRKLVGEGGMGRVYLARDLTLGRSVALKMVRELGVSPERFVREARITAQLNHPHIVQLYDVGEHGPTPYLALEYLEGESLRERLQRSTVTIDETFRILRAVAEALTHAHARGVRHCDLKPSNVMLPRDGRVRVVDFGIATEAVTSTHATGGTTDWMAPEQWRGEAATDPTDIWALGVIAFEALLGKHPFGVAANRTDRRAAVLDSSRAPDAFEREGVPDDVVSLISRSLSRSGPARPSASEWVAVLSAILVGESPRSIADSPFRGLAAFDERHTQNFFGRDDEIDAFLERFRDTSMLPIVGPSGVGKSSFLFGGLIPRLRVREGWTVLAFRPGDDPVRALAHRLVAAAETSTADPLAVSRLAAELRAEPSLLAVRLASIAATTQTKVLLAIDQLEELFTQGASPSDTQCVLAMLAGSADDASEPVRVTYTLRDDFLGRVPEVKSLFVLRALDALHMRQTITGPLDRLGYAFDQPTIIDEMIREVAESPAALPLLQFACRSLWDTRDVERKLLLEKAYRAQGGVAGSLARHADAVLVGMSAEEQVASRQMLTRLVIGSSSRRTLDRGELLSGLPAVAGAVLDRLIRARLLVQGRPSGKEALAVEIAHESLLVTWTQLKLWLEESAEERRFVVEMEEAATFWDKRGRRDEETWNAADLGGARRRARRLAVQLSARVEAFLVAGDARDAKQRRAARTRLATFVGLASTLTVGAVMLASEFRDQRNAAETQARALRLAHGNLGKTDLVLEPFDWVDERPSPVPLAQLPQLTWKLYAPAVGDVQLPGAAIPEHLVRVSDDGVEAPGGTAFLRVDGRGSSGQSCAASWVRLVALPGYAERGTKRRVAIPVPTCQASLASTALVPAGPFIYGGPGVPATKYPDYVDPERTIDLPGFRIDLTEVSNAQFAPFARLTATTGYAVPLYPRGGKFDHAGDDEIPVTSVDAFESEAFCRFMGKRLPTDHEWAKAARGGSTLDGKANPEPRRLYPWGSEFRRDCVNLGDSTDGFEWVAPVNGLACGASPYGARNLVGNVAEWVARTGQADSNDLRVIRGGAANSPVELEQVTTIFRNQREARNFDFATGIRCATDENPEEGSKWERH